MIKTTNPTAAGSAIPAGMLHDSKRAATGFAKTAPPIAPERMAIIVITTLTVERNSLGDDAKSYAAFAPASPASAFCLNLLRRLDTTASSAIAKSPFARIKILNIKPSMIIIYECFACLVVLP
jgi:hypothetical protein